MSKQTIKSIPGFTIIEVVLVLAVAGLVMMMVFIGLPALQRMQRNTQRTNDVERLQTAITNYQSNNRGAVPKNLSGERDVVRGHVDKQVNKPRYKEGNNWGNFYDSYILADKDTFTDPDGSPYGLIVQACGDRSLKQGDDCKKGQRSGLTFEEQSTGSSSGETATDAGIIDTKDDAYDTEVSDSGDGHAISIVTSATCQNERAVYASGSRKLALLYKKEGGGTICVNT